MMMIVMMMMMMMMIRILGSIVQGKFCHAIYLERCFSWRRFLIFSLSKSPATALSCDTAT